MDVFLPVELIKKPYNKNLNKTVPINVGFIQIYTDSKTVTFLPNTYHTSLSATCTVIKHFIGLPITRFLISQNANPLSKGPMNESEVPLLYHILKISKQCCIQPLPKILKKRIPDSF